MTDMMYPCEGNTAKCSLALCGGSWGPAMGSYTGRAGKDGKRRIRACGDPTARGKRNRTKGDTKARVARVKLGLAAPGKAGTRHEEMWEGDFRVEVKAGKQVGPIATRFYSARAQSNASAGVGDKRPFIMVAMPNGSADGIILMSLNDFTKRRGIKP